MYTFLNIFLLVYFLLAFINEKLKYYQLETKIITAYTRFTALAV